MKAYSREEAWRIANELFPTDYEPDCMKSEKAGYDIYWTTLEGGNSWISDLGNRLELNIERESGRIETRNIWIEEAAEKNILVDMTQALLDYCYKNNLILTRIDSQFNYKTYRWTTYGFTANREKITVNENLEAKRGL